MQEDIIVQKALANIGIEALNEMQLAALATFGKSNDIVLHSPTGSGKTLAFLLPLLTILTSEEKKIQSLIIAPSRELALQIEQVFRSLGAGHKVTCCYGGHPMRTEKKSLEHPPVVLIGTPGRIVDHIERETIQLDSVTTLILDEFDKSLELGFTREMKTILAHLPSIRRRILTSATSAIDIPSFVGLNRPVKLDYLKDSQETDTLKVYEVHSPEKDKLQTLYKLLCALGEGSSLVFCNQRESVERVSDYLTSMQIENEFFHGGLEQLDRERKLSRFRNGSSMVFVSTDLAARGLDIPEVKHVIHYHLPVNEEAYVHRNGRTARMHATGAAFLILNELETLPEYATGDLSVFGLPKTDALPVSSPWLTLSINKGKRDKLSKKDIVGFLFQKGGLEKSELGVVEVKESYSFAAIKREKYSSVLNKIREEKIKNMKAKFD